MAERADIRSLRQHLGLSQRRLAERARISATALRRLERGLSEPDPATLRRLARILKVSTTELRDAQADHARRATPGEGYTTARARTDAGRVTPRREPVPNGRRRVLDLFCGAGGLSHGFADSGAFVTTCGIDLLADRLATFVANHAHATGIAGDLRTLSLAEIRAAAGEIDVVVGGPPCQGFSSIRPFRTLTEGDPRNSLVEQYVLLIAELQPSWFVFENVVGLLTHGRGEKLAALLAGLRHAGYTTDWRVVNAACFGVPQHRERILIVGNNQGITLRWPRPTHRVSQRSMAGQRPEVIRAEPAEAAALPAAVTLMEAIGDLPAVAAGEAASDYGAPASGLTAYQAEMRRGSGPLTHHRATRHSPRMLEIIRHAGANISALPAGMVSSGFSSCYSRLAPDRPSTTLTVNFVHPASNRCIHPFQDRALTPREGARLQSFPDRYHFHGNVAQVVKQIGNAVAPRVGGVIADAILASETGGDREWKGHERRLNRGGAELRTDAATSKRMQRIPRQRTRPEERVRVALEALAIPHLQENDGLPGKPDFVAPDRKWALFVHGCYWHAHEGCAKATVPERNRDYWLAKFARNRERDAAVQAALRGMGLRVEVVWECETREGERLGELLRSRLDA